MAPFRFRLERLLSYRCSLEDEAKKELDVRRLHMEDAATETARLQEKTDTTEIFWREQTGARLNLPLLQLTSEYYRFMNGRLAHQRELERQSLQRVEEQQEALHQSWRQRRVLELLREKAQNEHRRQDKLQENRFLDELALFSFTRKE